MEPENMGLKSPMERKGIKSSLMHRSPGTPGASTRGESGITNNGALYIEGILDIHLQSHTQKLLNCVVGEHVTSEVPWKIVKKETIDDNLELHDESSDFLPIKDQLQAYPGDEVMIGYNATAVIENQFRICVTEEAKKSVQEVLAEQKAEQELKIKNAINKTIGIWNSYGSEKEVNESIVKNLRPLVEVETVMTIGSIRAPADFSDRDVNAVKHGYQTFREPRHQPETIRCLRLNTGAQAVPETAEGEAQTVVVFPTNMHTQYEYLKEIPETLTEAEVENTTKLFEKHDNYLDTNLEYNEILDLHKNEYSLLDDQDEDIKIPDQINFHELQSLSNVRQEQRCISSVSWHPMWSGIVAVSYANQSLNSVTQLKKMTDDHVEILTQMKSVLIWSLNDSLNPKIVLECLSEVHALAFCPHNENILVAGCLNGSVVIWDISYKLNEAEKVRISSDVQKKYRRELLNLVSWKMDEDRYPPVRPTVVSSHEFWHKMSVTQVKWLDPSWKMTPTGTWEDRKEEDPIQMQFITCARDGVVNFWDLNEKDSSKEQKKKKKKKQVSRERLFLRHLEPFVSPYVALNKMLRPLFRIVVRNEKDDDEICYQLSQMSLRMPPVEYRRREGPPAVNLTDRIKYFPIINVPAADPPYEFYVGTQNGLLLFVRWESVPFQARLPVHTTFGHIESRGVYHSGRVHAVRQSPFIEDMLLTISNDDFALWRKGMMETPIFYRRSSVRLTGGMWSPHLPSMFYITRDDGTLVVWDLLRHTECPIMTQRITSHSITGIYLHRLPMPRDFVGISDSRGTFRVFLIPSAFLKSSPGDIKALNAFFERDRERRVEIKEWQTTWLETNADAIQEQQSRAKEQLKLDMEARLEKKRLEEEEVRAHEANLLKIKSMAKRSHEAKVKARGQEKWDEMEKKRMTLALMDKKHLNKDDLIKKQRPLLNVNERKQKALRRIEDSLRDKDKVFDENVAILFPEVVEKVEVNTYENNLLKQYDDHDEMFAKQFDERRNKVLDLLDNDPLPKSRDWKSLLKEGIERKNSFMAERGDNMEWRRERLEKRQEAHRKDSERLAKERGDELAENVIREEDFVFPAGSSEHLEEEE